MPEDSKKNQQKAKHEPKDQRRPRQRNQAAAEKKTETKRAPSPKKIEEPKTAKPVYEEPGPEFYKNLKRETEEILKITEEANSKYKKKEIQSNWSKYEMPIETYEEIEEQENLGADYEKLIEAPLSIGGHFQFKHEKTWDINTGPSLYDKYFDINMDNLALAVSTLPFYQRNALDKTMFSQSEILSMDNRAIRYKQKYYNDRSYTTPDLEVKDKILDSLKENLNKKEDALEDQLIDPSDNEYMSETKDFKFKDCKHEPVLTAPNSEVNNINDMNINIQKSIGVIKTMPEVDSKNITQNTIRSEMNPTDLNKVKNKDLDDIDDLIFETETSKPKANLQSERSKPEVKLETEANKSEIKLETETSKLEAKLEAINCKEEITQKETKNTETESRNPVIESPEDLEKWLDDFLDG